MKRRFVLLWLCCAVTVGSYSTAQEIKTIKIDFSDQNPPTTIDAIKKGDFYRIVITGINQNLYKISLTSADSVLSKPQKTPAFGEFNLDALTKVTSGIGAITTSVAGFGEAVALIQKKGELKGFDAKDARAQSVADQMEQELTWLKNAESGLKQVAGQIDALKMEVAKIRLQALRADNEVGPFDFDQALADVESIRGGLAPLQSAAKIAGADYEKFSVKNKAIIDKDPALSGNDKKIKEAYAKLDTTVSEALSSVSADKAYELLAPVVFIDNNRCNDYTSLPIQFTGEQARVNITATPRDEKFATHTYSTSILFPTKLKTYTVVGLSFFYSSLYDKAYSSVKSTSISGGDTTTYYSYAEENSTKGELGIAAMLRVGNKTRQITWLGSDGMLGWHGTLGAGVTLSSKVKPRLLFGGGLTAGDRHMLAIDAGFAAGYVDRKSTVIDLGQSYAEKASSPVVASLKLGCFISLGYTYQF